MTTKFTKKDLDKMVEDALKPQPKIDGKTVLQRIIGKPTK